MDRATPNLPSADFERTARFYGALGFAPGYREAGWMMLERGGVTLEFFRHAELDPDGTLVRLDPELKVEARTSDRKKCLTASR
ncbi:MAG TPA: hypothetical protein VF704_12865 [Allosphingosinicella sp.]